MRCFEGRVYDVQCGAWVACERCLGSGRVVVYVYPKLKHPHGNAASTSLRAGALLPGPRLLVLRGGGGSRKLVIASLGVHTSSKNPHPVSRTQAYIAYPFDI
jgi:hypothetical protein